MKISTCNYVYIISNYLIAILQVMNITLSESYTNNLINTKCLNTAVMLIVILIGQKKIPCIQQCDVGNTIQRHIQSTDNNNTITDKLTRSICRASKKPYIYYIMLTDGQLQHRSSNKTIYFPGHVFILEKTNNNEYLIYRIVSLWSSERSSRSFSSSYLFLICFYNSFINTLSKILLT